MGGPVCVSGDGLAVWDVDEQVEHEGADLVVWVGGFGVFREAIPPAGTLKGASHC